MRARPLVLVATLLSVGCGSGADRAATPTAPTGRAGTLQALWDRPGANVTVVPGTGDFGPGKVRYSFLVVNQSGRAVRAPTARVWVATGLSEKPFAGTTAKEEVVAPGSSHPELGEASRIFVAQLRLPRAGTYWLVAEPKGRRIQALGQLEVKPHSDSPAVGVPAPRSDTPTLADAPAARLTTRTPPDLDLLRFSVADSIRAQRPFVVAFATPKFCQSRTCGPVVDVVERTSHRFPQVRFIHVEVYEGNDPQRGYNRWMQQWGLRTEPWVFVVGADGRIAAKFEGALSDRELRAAVAASLR